MAEISTILIPTRPQPDTVVAIFLLKKFGYEEFAGIASATVAVQPSLPEGDTFESMLGNGTLALDLGGGVLDHHGKNTCTSELVAQYLEIEKDPSIGQLLTYAKRDDQDGKGTVSKDALDRAFGLSGLIAALNKANPTEPHRVVEAVLPLLEAHWQSAYEHHVELPRDVAAKRASGEYHELSIASGERMLKLACVVSDKPSMPTYLRSERGGRADVVLQKAQSTNHTCVLTKQERKVDLSKVMGLIRLREAELAGVELVDDEVYVSQTGRIDEIPYWYYDPATNSLLNGGLHSKDVVQTLIAWDVLKNIVRAGLELVVGKK